MFKKKRDDYSKFLVSLVSPFRKDSGRVKRVLESEDAKDTYNTMKERGVPGHIIKDVFYRTMLESEGKMNGPEEYVARLARNLARLQVYGLVLEDMHKMGLIDNKTFEGCRGDTIKEYKSGLNKLNDHVFGSRFTKVVMWVSFVVSGWFLLMGLINAVITGAVIGGGVVDYNMAYGVVFLLFGLALSHFHLK